MNLNSEENIYKRVERKKGEQYTNTNILERNLAC